MSLLVALWLSIFQALAGHPATRPDGAAARAASAAVETSVRRSEPRPTRDAPRFTRVVTGVVSATGAPPATHPTPATSLGSPAALLRALVGAPDASLRTLRASHAVAALGAVLPYFATAPPLQG
ncbi:hypothetical protein [Gemmatirosa kalamazoonensis]|uniref:hypothetical protein n=1 Tax=Gemmatirosa kalamazoonensis TaxID=861299 RepID=UPI0011DD4183|nr:hypothetical protein [Gemmatirosa kalamazoonensis]